MLRVWHVGSPAVPPPWDTFLTTSPSAPHPRTRPCPPLSTYPVCCPSSRGLNVRTKGGGQGQMCTHTLLCPGQGEATAIPQPRLAAPQPIWWAFGQGHFIHFHARVFRTLNGPFPCFLTQSSPAMSCCSSPTITGMLLACLIPSHSQSYGTGVQEMLKTDGNSNHRNDAQRHCLRHLSGDIKVRNVSSLPFSGENPSAGRGVG